MDDSPDDVYIVSSTIKPSPLIVKIGADNITKTFYFQKKWWAAPEGTALKFSQRQLDILKMDQKLLSKEDFIKWLILNEIQI